MAKANVSKSILPRSSGHKNFALAMMWLASASRAVPFQTVRIDVNQGEDKYNDEIHNDNALVPSR
jgi:hypothetical protein